MADLDESQPTFDQVPPPEEAGEAVPEVVEKYENLTADQQQEVKEVFEMFDKENN